MSDINLSGSFRVKKNPFTQVSNSALRDSNLSLKAKGLYSLIQSYITIPEFILYKSYLMSICREKEKAFDSAWKELKINGYLKQYRIPKGKNDSFVYEYELLDVADLTTPPLINLNKKGEVSISQKDDNSHTPHFVPYANGTLCEAHPMRNGGGINNTDLNNTDLNNIDLSNIDSSNIDSKSSQSQTEEGLKSDETMTSDFDDDKQQSEIFEMKKGLPQTTADQSKGLKSPLKINVSNLTEHDYITYKKIIQENIEYNHYLHNRRMDIELIDELINCMLDVVCTKGDTVKINGEEKSRNMVASQYLKINSLDIEHILDRYKEQRHKITRLHSYLKTMLYTVKQESGHYYTNAVRTDGIVH